jgi:Zn-dependent protease with chaperone function
MRNTRFINLEAGRSVGKAPHQETALFLAALTFGLAMLSLLAVLALAGVVELTHLLPFYALPLLLFIVSAPLLQRWWKGEAEVAAIEEAAHRASHPPPPTLRRASTDGVDATRQAPKSTASTRR